MSQSATATHFLNTFRDADSTTSLGSLFQCLTTLSTKRSFAIINLAQFQVIAPPSNSSYEGKETDLHLTTTYKKASLVPVTATCTQL